MNGADGISDIEGKAAMGSGERAGKQPSFKFVSMPPQFLSAAPLFVCHPERSACLAVALAKAGSVSRNVNGHTHWLACISLFDCEVPYFIPVSV